MSHSDPADTSEPKLQTKPPSSEKRAANSDSRNRYWRANSRLIMVLLSIWAFVSLGCGIILVPVLNQYSVGRLPAGFWFAQQGSIFIFVILIFVYAVAMDWLDKRHDVEE